MSDTAAIRVEGLSKRYRIGAAEAHYKTLRESLVDAAKAPFRRIAAVARGEAARSKADTIWALRDVSLKVNQGDVVGIIGKNGAGKTTLLKILSRITKPTRGTVDLYGRVGSLLEVGTGFHPELSGRENIYLSGAILGMTRTEVKRKFDEIVAFSEVERFIDTPMKYYSSGMYVRVAFAVAAHLEPEILLVDEVLAVGDGAFQKKCLGKMGDVAKEGRTVLFVSHNMSAISSLTNLSFCFERGRIIDQGQTDQVISNYVSRITEHASDLGWADLATAPHVAGRREVAALEWIRIVDSQGKQTGTLMEGDPIRIEVGFSVREPGLSFELAYDIRPMDNSPLFISPSGVRRADLPGRYSVTSSIEPNSLQAGAYTVNLYLFVGGQKEDMVSPALQFNVEAQLPQDDNPFYMTWAKGYSFRFDYRWGEIAQIESVHGSE